MAVDRGLGFRVWRLELIPTKPQLYPEFCGDLYRNAHRIRWHEHVYNDSNYHGKWALHRPLLN